MAKKATKRKGSSFSTLLITLFYKLLALFFLITAIKYWMLVLGISHPNAVRFDLMAEHWKIASVILCVLNPIVAVGLWSRQVWGPVMWFMVIATECIMFLGLPHLFGENPTQLIFHGIAFTGFLILFFLERKMANKK